MTERGGNMGQPYSSGKKGRRSLGAAILARTLADRRVLIRKLVIGEAIGERPARGLGLRTSVRARPSGQEPGED